jgi:hypothetical protein
MTPRKEKMSWRQCLRGCAIPRSQTARRFSKCSSNIVETAKANGLEPYEYLRRLFERLPYAKTVADYESLLPFATFAHS